MKIKNISIKDRIKQYFFNNPTSRLRVRQIERLLKIPLPSVIRYAKELENEEMLASTDISGVNFYTAGRSNKRFLIEKKLYNIKKLFDSGLVDYLAQEYSNPIIIVFGSYSKGEDIESSDIDLYIETKKKQDFNLEKSEKILGRKIQVFNFENITKIPNKELSNNIINGIVLNGFLEVFR